IYVGEDLSSHYNIPEKLGVAAFFIMAAAIVDFLDGFVARLLKASSDMGKQLDSLSDVVSFGVAPSVILYQLLRTSFIKEENGLETSIAWLLPAFIVACAAAYRLARFNLDNSQSYGFKGVPVPAAGLFIASFPLILHYGNSVFNVNEWLTNKWVLYAVIVLVSWLMVSTLPLMALKFRDFSIKNNIPKIILLVVAAIAAFIFNWLAVPIIFIAYIILSLIFKKTFS
ncbi:MAG: CDP-diacylglycerol--serine O-phosphatidyltransferase, partial [Ferruginibacter sp.]